MDENPSVLVDEPTDVGTGGFRRLPVAALVAIAAATHDGVLVFDLDGRILMMNHALAKLVGHERWELEGESLGTVVGDQTDDVLARGRVIADEGVARSSRIALRRCDGAFVECDARLSATELDGRPVIVGILHEVEVRRRYGSTDIEEIDAKVHELVNSLAGLRGYVDLFRRVPEEKQQVILERLERIAGTTAARLENLLAELPR